MNLSNKIVRFGFGLLVGIIPQPRSYAQTGTQITVIVKNTTNIGTHYPSLSNANPADGLRPSDKISNFVDAVPSEGIGAKPDKNGVIKTAASSSGPYYRLNALQLYIEPGGSLTVDFNHKAKPGDLLFTGKNADVNQWLNQDLFLFNRDLAFDDDGFQDTLQSYHAYRKLLFQRISKARDELGRLNINSAFKQDGNVRLNFVAINALIAYLSYNITWKFNIKRSLDNDTVKDKKIFAMAHAFYQNKHDSITNDINLLLPNVYLKNYTDFPEVAAALSEIANFDPAYFVKVEPDSYKEFYSVISAINEGNNNDFFFSKKLETLALNIHEPDLKAIVSKWQNTYGGLQTDQPALDVVLQDTAGHKIKLADLKGKSLYIDVWATWCGPCVQLKPYFEGLADQYRQSNISFVSISADQDKSKWVAYVKSHPIPGNVQQYVIDDEPAFSKLYLLNFIPRFMLISKDFRFITAQAPTPDDPAAAKYIDQFKN